MKPTSRSLYLQIVAILVAFSFGISAYAESPREELVHAYHLLKHADHDYGGHREAAMDEVSAAGRELGLHLEGDDMEGERQWKSDERVREARRLVREARDKMEAHDRDRVAAHLEKAVKELDAALATR